MLTGSDGYQYKDITQRLLGKPIENWRNSRLFEIRKEYDTPEGRKFCEDNVTDFITYHDGYDTRPDSLSRSPS